MESSADRATNLQWPRITVITPSFNQAEFLERTILSVIGQNYPNLEYLVIDGGSTDGSIEIIKKYESAITWWVSEPDAGQTDAINKGIARATGDWIGWQNSDDVYLGNVFAQVAELSLERPEVDLVIGDLQLIDADDNPGRVIKYVRPSYKALLAEGMLAANQAAFWKRSLHDQIGVLNTEMQCSFDYDWFVRLTERTQNTLHVPRVWGALRLHSETKTSNRALQFAKENEEVQRGRELRSWEYPAYRLRRGIAMLLQGQFRYVLIGLARRACVQLRPKARTKDSDRA